MGIPFIIAGLILLLAGAGWFTGAATVGWILLIGGGVLALLQLLWALFMGAAVASSSRDLNRRSRF
jgi:hypothetical protein